MKPLPEVRCARSNCVRPPVILAGKRTRLCLAHQEVKTARKYKNRPAHSELANRRFDSESERRDGEDAVLAERAGAIRKLRFQVPYELRVNGILICRYIADRVFEEKNEKGRWQEVVADTKGFRTNVYALKKKLMLAIHGIEIRETGNRRSK